MTGPEWKSFEHIGEAACRGDLIEFQRDQFNHWAVFAGRHGEIPMVIHLTREGKVHKVMYDQLKTVADCRRCRIHNKYDARDKPFGEMKILRRAHKKLDYARYDKMTYNSEHFATYCRSGVPRSEKICFGLQTEWQSGDALADQLHEGDLIEFEARNLIANHWAVFVGRWKGGPIVAHLWRSGEEGYMVRYDQLLTVAEGRTCRINNEYDRSEQPLESMEILRRAHEMLDKTDYDPLLNNCEHFAKYCRNGRRHCGEMPPISTDSRQLLQTALNWKRMAKLGKRWSCIRRIIKSSKIIRALNRSIQCKPLDLNKIPPHMLIQVLRRMEGRSVYHMRMANMPMRRFVEETGVKANMRNMDLTLSYYYDNADDGFTGRLKKYENGRKRDLYGGFWGDIQSFVEPTHFNAIKLRISDLPRNEQAEKNVWKAVRELQLSCDYMNAEIPKDYIKMLFHFKGYRKVKIWDVYMQPFGMEDVLDVIKDCDDVFLSLSSTIPEDFYNIVRNMSKFALESSLDLPANIGARILTEIVTMHRPEDKLKELRLTMTSSKIELLRMPGFLELVSRNTILNTSEALNIFVKEISGCFIVAFTDHHRLVVNIVTTKEDVYLAMTNFLLPEIVYDNSVYFDRFMNTELEEWPPLARTVRNSFSLE